MISISDKSIKTIIKESLLHEHVDHQVAEYVAEGLVSTSLRGVNSNYAT